MNYRKLGKTGLKVSELSLGGLPLKSGLKDVKSIIERALELGINYIDTAPGYGDSEKVLGQSLEGIKKPYIMSTKIGARKGQKDFNPQNKDIIRKTVKDSLYFLKRDYVDILMIHEPDRPGFYDWFPDWENFHGPVCEVLDELKKDGIIRYRGLGGTTAYTMAEIIKKNDYDVVLTAFNYSLLWQEALNSVISEAKRKNMGIIIGSPLQQGVLAKCYVEEVENGARWLSPPRRNQLKELYRLVEESGISIVELALRFVISNSDVSTVLMGAKSVFEAESNVETVQKGPLPEDILEEIQRIYKMVPFRPAEEPRKLPFNNNYKGPGI